MPNYISDGSGNWVEVSSEVQLKVEIGALDKQDAIYEASD